LTTGQALTEFEARRNDPRLAPAIGFLRELGFNGNLPSPRQLGRYLARNRERPCGGRMFTDEVHDHQSVWRVTWVASEAGGRGTADIPF
jgi:hypothetical protein